eukprot:GAHX01002920.1.p1 GENE.GAHX01002920.1~~GAHX01002920.1.p1  ORF type:complete len:251 (+),score=18.84 GAHX01002920.1:39-791(+)
MIFTMIDRFLSTIPPVSAVLIYLTCALTLISSLNMRYVYKFIFNFELVYKELEIHRLITPFFTQVLTKPIEFLYVVIFLHTLVKLEQAFISTNKKTSDFVFMLLFICTLLLLGTAILPAYLLGYELSMALVVVYSRLAPDIVWSLYGIFNVRNKYYPLVTILVSFGNSAERFKRGVLAAMVGYLYFFMTTGIVNFNRGKYKNLKINTPNIFKRIFDSNNDVNRGNTMTFSSQSVRNGNGTVGRSYSLRFD